MGTWAQGTSSHGNGQGWVETGRLAAFIGGNGGSLEKGRILQSSEASLGNRVGRPISGLVANCACAATCPSFVSSANTLASASN